jgi:hypothetical protein
MWRALKVRALLLGILTTVTVIACNAAPAMTTPATPVATLATPSDAAATAATPGPTGRLDHPTGATEVVLRMHRQGGFLWPGTTLDVAPTFTLYGDGTVIYTADEALGGNDPRRGLRVARMTEEQVAALIAFALGAGGLAEAAEAYTDVPVADATGITFTIDAAGISKTVGVYALGEGLDEPGPETAHRQRFLRLFELLASFGDEVARGNATDAGAYEPEAYRVTLFPDEFDELQVTGDWPWEDLEPADFQRDRSGFGVGTVTPAQAEALSKVAGGDMGEPVVVGPDGVQYLIRFRPLLPDEIE